MEPDPIVQSAPETGDPIATKTAAMLAEADDFNTPAPDGVNPPVEADPNPDPGNPDPVKKPTDTPSELSLKGAWEFLGSKKIPINPEYLKGNFGENVTEEEALVNSIIEAVGKPQVDDPFVRGYLETPVEKRGDYIRQYNEVEQVLSMSPKDGLTMLYQQMTNDKGERLYSDEDIAAEIGSKGKIQLDREWNEVRARIEEQRNAALQGPQISEEEYAAQVEAVNAERMKGLDEIFKDEEKLETIGGIPYSPEIRTKFQDMYRQMNTINPKTGTPYLYQFLEDPKNLRNAIRGLVLLQDNGLLTHVSSFKENFKEGVFNKLDPQPRPKSGNAQFTPANFPEP